MKRFLILAMVLVLSVGLLAQLPGSLTSRENGKFYAMADNSVALRVLFFAPDPSGGTLPSSRDTREYQKFILDSDGEVAVRAVIANDSLHVSMITADTLYVSDSAWVNLLGVDTLWANWARILKLTDGTATLEGGDLTGLDSLQVSKVGAYTLYGKLTAGAIEIEGSNFDINGGAIDGTTIGVSSASTGKFSTLAMADNTAGKLLVGSGSTYVPKALSGDGTIDANGVLTLSATQSDSLASTKKVFRNVSSTFSGLGNDTSYVYVYDDGSSVHLMATKDDNGTETVVKIAEQPDLVNLSSKGAVYSFDGVDDVVTVIADAKFANIWDNDGTISAWIYPKSNGEGLEGRIAEKDERWRFHCSTSDGTKMKLRLYAYFSTTNGYWTTTNTEVSLNEWSFVTITYNNSSVANDPVIYLNGQVLALTEGGTPVGTRVDDSAVNMTIGNNSYTNTTFDGQIAGLIPFNLAITNASERAQIALGNIPAKYQWGSQTALMTDGTFDTAIGAGTWTQPAGTGWSIAGGKATYDNVSNLSCLSQNLTIVKGKQYRFTFDIENVTTNADIVLANNNGTVIMSAGKQSFANGTGQTIEFTSLENSTALQIFAYTTSSDAFDMDNVSLIQLGAVLAMLPQNMTASTAYDASSNNLDGTVYGATLLNAKVADAFVNPNKAAVDDDVIATVKHSGYDSAGNLDDFVKFETIMQDVTATTEDGGYKISAMVGGSMTNTLEYDGNTGILNIPAILNAKVYNYYADTSSVNDSWGFTASSISAYTTGMSIFVNIGVANTDGATLQINALGAKAVLKMHDTALATNNVEVGQIIHLIYDGTQFQMLSQVAN